MSDEEKNIESVDKDSNINQQGQKSEGDDKEADSYEDLKIELEEMYNSSVNFMNTINQIKDRHVNAPLILTQFFSRYSSAQTILFLTAALVLVVLQSLGASLGSFSHSTLIIGALTTVLMIAFLCVTLKKILSALTDIKRLKHGFCSLGYQIVKRSDDSNESSDDPSSPPIIAYKDYANMIRTMKLPKNDYKKYFIVSVLALFLDNKNPNKITLFDEMPHQISYEFKTQTFTQEWKSALCALFPIAMIILYAISAYLSYAAYTTLNQ